MGAGMASFQCGRLFSGGAGILQGALQTRMAQLTLMGPAPTGEGSYNSTAPFLINERKEAMSEPSESLAESAPTTQYVLNAIQRMETRFNTRFAGLEARMTAAQNLLEMILNRVKAMCYW